MKATASNMKSRVIPTAANRPANDPIFALHEEAVRRAAEGESVLNSTLGVLLLDDGRLATMPVVSEALSAVSHYQAAGYAPINGPPDYLRAVIGDALEGSSLPQYAIAVASPGSTGALHHAVQNFLEPGQAALAPSYYWGPYRTILRHAGRSLEVFNMFDGENRLDMDAFEAALDEQIEEQGRSLVLFNFPCNNPTGYTLNHAEWSAVAEIVRRAGRRGPVAFLLDHAYLKFGDPENRWLSCVPRMLESATVLVAWTISKSLAQYGSRVGALVALEKDPAERERIENALGYSCRATWSNCNHLGMLAATELLRNPRMAAQVEAERSALSDLLGERARIFNECAAEAGLGYPRYEGGFFVSVFTPNAERTAAAMRRDGVFVVPLDGAVRVAICATTARDLPRLVSSLADGIEETSSPWR